MNALAAVLAAVIAASGILVVVFSRLIARAFDSMVGAHRRSLFSRSTVVFGGSVVALGGLALLAFALSGVFVAN